MRVITTLFLLLLLFLRTAFAQTTPTTADEALRLGNQQLAANEQSKALASFTECIRLDEKKADCYSRRAKAYIAQKQYDLALKDAIAAKDINPNAAESWSLLATINGLKGEVYTAISNMAEAIRYNPANPDYYLQRAALRCSIPELKVLAAADELQAKLKGAVVTKPCVTPSTSTQTTQVAPPNADPKTQHQAFQSGLVFKTVGNYAAAEAEFTKVLRAAPNDTEALRQRGYSRYMQKKYVDALTDYSNLVKLDSKNAAGWYERAFTSVAMENYSLAVFDYDEAITLEPANADFRAERGFAYFKLKMYDLAAPDYTKAIELKPRDAKFWNARGNVRFEEKKYDLALADYSKAIELDPGKNYHFSNRAVVYEKLGKKDLAAADLATADRLRSTTATRITVPAANETVLFFDNFDDNKHNWPVGTSDYVDGIIANGRQTIDLRTDVYHRTMIGAAIAPQIDQTKDFMIETSITFLSGNESYPFGINWGMKDLHQNSFEFNIARGHFSYAKIVAGQYQNIITWTAHSAIRSGAGATNKLTIRKRGAKLELSVNDTLVATKDYEAYTAPASIGFNIGFKKKIEIDYLRVVQFK